MKKQILIIDDDVDLCTLLQKFLIRNGYDVDTAYSGKKGVLQFEQKTYDIIFCDFRLGDTSGTDILVKIKQHNPNTIVLIITGYSDIKTAIDVIKHGAYDYITKPLIPDEILKVLQTSIAQYNNNGDGVVSQTVPNKAHKVIANDAILIGKDTATKELYKQIAMVAPTNYSIILYGESGTGKEVIAKTIHEQSSRKNQPFVALDCGTLSKELAGSELFGHVKGSFTGAINDKDGHFELANGGTLFLDEVANLSIDVQASLLRVIQERKYKRIGGSKEIACDIRIIVASNENLQAAYQSGNFREDLYHRFNEFSINLPALRNRKKDIRLFANYFLQKTNEELNKNIETFDDDVFEMFESYTWPGNLREFRNVVRRAVLLTDNNSIVASVLPWEITTPSTITAIPNGNTTVAATQKKLDLKDSATKAEYLTIMEVLKQVKFNKSKAAELLNIDRKTLYNKIKTYEDSIS